MIYRVPPPPPPTDNRGFINVLSTEARGFHRQEKLFELHFFLANTFLQKVTPGSKIILTASQFAQCLALNKNPETNRE